MEINNNPSPPSNSQNHQLVTWSSDFDLLGSSQINRSFTCAFCKRGFSNAQALGGHMNIHRKDRAKLRQADDDNLLSLDICSPSRVENIAPVSTQEKNSSSIESACKETENRVDLDDDGDLATMKSKRDGNKVDSSVVGKEEIGQVMSPATAELDLELRLGLEPQYRTSTSKVKEFF